MFLPAQSRLATSQAAASCACDLLPIDRLWPFQHFFFASIERSQTKGETLPRAALTSPFASDLTVVEESRTRLFQKSPRLEGDLWCRHHSPFWNQRQRKRLSHDDLRGVAQGRALRTLFRDLKNFNPFAFLLFLTFQKLESQFLSFRILLFCLRKKYDSDIFNALLFLFLCFSHQYLSLLVRALIPSCLKRFQV